jgi:hypothetical protein
MRADTTWFREAQWGVLVHYLGKEGMSAEEWNRLVDDFDVKVLAEQLRQVKASYFFLTIGQITGHYCAPNAAYDSFVGIEPSKCSRRDLIADMYKALKPHGIRMMVYMPSDAPRLDPVATERLEWEIGTEPDHKKPVHGLNARGQTWGKCNPPNIEYQKKWEAVIREWSLRWGKNIHGWWFDGCYFANAMYRRPVAPNFESFAAAAKAGNPDSLVAFNPGVITPVIRYTEHEDYTAGEISSALPVCCSYDNNVEKGKVDGAQYHVLSFLGEAWSAGPLRFQEDLAVAYTRHVIGRGGVMTWDVPTNEQGLISDEFLRQLEVIGKASEQIPLLE